VRSAALRPEDGDQGYTVVPASLFNYPRAAAIDLRGIANRLLHPEEYTVGKAVTDAAALEHIAAWLERTRGQR